MRGDMKNIAIKVSLILFLLNFAFVAGMQGIYAREVLNFGYIEFKPFFYTTEDGEAEGPTIDKIIKIANRAGYDVIVKGYPMKRLTQYIKSGDLDFTVTLKSVFNDEDIYASNRKIVNISLRAYTIGQQPPIVKKEELSGKRIGVFRGFNYGGWINYIKDEKNIVNYHEVSTHEQLFRILELDRVDYILDYMKPSSSVIEKLEIRDLNYNDVVVMPVHMLVSKKTSVGNPAEIIDKLNKAYEELIAEGSVQVE